MSTNELELLVMIIAISQYIMCVQLRLQHTTVKSDYTGIACNHNHHLSIVILCQGSAGREAVDNHVYFPSYPAPACAERGQGLILNGCAGDPGDCQL